VASHVVVNDSLQTNYSYRLDQAYGKSFDPEFIPQLTPKQMLELGVFGGWYLNDCQAEFPNDWFVHAKISMNSPDPKLNFYEVKASQSLGEWQRKGWIYPDDPRGWFQWYCRYYMGRRLPQEDARQIKRWKAISRHIAQLQKNCQAGDLNCRPVQRQALLHWAYDSRLL